jgi:hypothetical protein
VGAKSARSLIAAHDSRCGASLPAPSPRRALSGPAIAQSLPSPFGRDWKPMIDETNDEKEFVPKGAIAFFAAMLCSFAVVWLAFYALLLHRR